MGLLNWLFMGWKQNNSKKVNPAERSPEPRKALQEARKVLRTMDLGDPVTLAKGAQQTTELAQEVLARVIENLTRDIEVLRHQLSWLEGLKVNLQSIGVDQALHEALASVREVEDGQAYVAEALRELWANVWGSEVESLVNTARGLNVDAMNALDDAEKNMVIPEGEMTLTDGLSKQLFRGERGRRAHLPPPPRPPARRYPDPEAPPGGRSGNRP